MDVVAALLNELESLDVRLWIEDGSLRYSAPKGVMNKALLERMASHKQALLDGLAKQLEQAKPGDESIPVLVRGRGLPLSNAQQRFWFLDRLDRGNSATFVMPPIVLRLEGRLDRLALQSALNRVVQRHEVLRSAFRIENDQPVQVPLADIELVMPSIDLSAQGVEEQERAVAAAVREQALTPFELDRGEALMRARLYALSDRHHVFILTLHHIIADGWSMGILVQELAHLYARLSAGLSEDVADDLPPLPIQYADYASWERSRMTGALLERQRDYWLQHLSDAPTLLQLPTDRPRPRVRGNRGQVVNFALPQSDSDALNRLCRQSGVTPFMALLALYGVLLCRHTDAEDLVIGSPIAVRTHSQTEPLIGLFLNTLALRLDLSGNPGLGTLLERVRQTALSAFEHREIPFDQVLQALGIERALDHTPLFQVLFALQNAPMGPVTLEGLRITPQPTESLHAPFDLVLSLEDGAAGYHGFFRYNTDLFEHATIERLTRHFQNLVAALVADPKAPVRSVSMLTEAEMAQLARWRGGLGQYPVTTTLGDRFREQTRLRPDAVALRCDERSLSYAELDAESDRIAARLRSKGVNRGDRVGLCAERSPELLIGLLAIVKLGAAYVPLDPGYPIDRLTYMIEDSGLQVALTHGITPELPVPCLALADPASELDDTSPLPTWHDPDTIAYIIYTSGSTGRPKGVEVSHGNVLRLFDCCAADYNFGSEDVWTLFHSYAFDFSVWEIWGALLFGGQLVVVPYGVSRSPERFLELLRLERVTVLNQTPSAFRQLIEADRRAPDQAPLALKWVIFGGEALDPRSLTPWVDRHGLSAPQLVNMYGITETTVHVTLHRISEHDLAEGGSLIGVPLSDLSIDLVDRYGQRVPTGVAGEILVGGAGLAKGYLNRPELTVERFAHFQAEPGRLTALPADSPGSLRLYRSGDLGRWLPRGGLEYLGRIDQQVKIRGFRIELGEIESALAQHPKVSEAMVEVRQDAAGAQLVAYVVSPDGALNTLSGDLRAHLKARLPDYMVPARVLVLERFPLTVNGKLDRRALAGLLDQQAATGMAPGAVSAPPETPLEQFLAGIWREVLGLGQVGLDDNFFELGGDSIRGAIVVNKIQERFQSVVYVVALFEAPTLRQLVDYFRVHYPEAVAKFEHTDSRMADDAAELAAVTESDLDAFRRLIPPVNRLSAARRNPRAVFVLSPPRSGSTLLRVLLGGHPQLFSPPELELLGFDSLGQRRQVCSGRDAFWLEGTQRALMEALQVDADTAKRLMAEREDADQPVSAFYGELQGWLGGRLLVDKSPSYALDLETLRRAETWFEAPLYLHLHRHPYGMISSFEEARLNQIFFRYPHNYPVRRLAELIWLHSHQTIQTFLADIPPERQMAISFEHITQAPEASVKQLCAFIGIDYDPNMLDLYSEQGQQARMTDGPYRESKMLGDTKFLGHKRIDPTVADRWRGLYRSDFLGEASWTMAQRLGYPRTAPGGRLNIEPVMPRPADWPLSFAQQRMWFLDQLEAAGAAYNMPVALQLDGHLRAPALASSLQALCQRHEGLRSQFVDVAGEPRVRLLETLPGLVEVDLSGLTAEARAAELQQRLRADAETPFNLAQGPLIRATLVCLEAECHALLLNMHHIVSDGWSMGLLVAELSALYNAEVSARTAALKPLPVQYGDYACWQRQYLDATRLAQQLDYWRTHLAGAPALLELPSDHPRPAIQRFAGDTLAFNFEPGLVTGLRSLAEQAGVSLYMLLMAGFAVLLARHSGQSDLMIGSPTANRTRAEVEPLIGVFVNTLVMRLQPEPGLRFNDFLSQVRKTALAAYAHQDLPFEQLVEALKPPRNLSYTPVFQVMFSLQSQPPVLPHLAGLAATDITLRQVVAKFDLSLAVTEYPDTLEAVFEYSTDLFERDSIERLADQYRTLLDAIVHGPGHNLGQLPLLSVDQQKRMRIEWNATEVVYPGPATLHGLFEAQVERTPDALAVIAGSERLSYRELDHRAQVVANTLRDAGFTPGALAAVFCRRSLDMLVGLLAILKAGGAYVPLDPNYPRDRIRYVLDQAKARWVLTQRDLLASLPDGEHGCLCLDDGRCLPPALAAESEANADLAYVIYTSGSTGNPKGVAIPHSAVVNFLQAMRERPGIDATDTVLAVTTVSFDIAVLELFLPLSVGARVVIADEAMTRDADTLMTAMSEHVITLMQATPATWRLLLAAGWSGQPGLKLLCGGEALPAALAAALLPRCASLWNMYGPTETTVWSTCHQVSETDVGRATVPIGTPIGNTRLYVLDASGQSCPPGVAGELLIGGAGVAAGYLHRPDLTAERFQPDPFVPGARIYRTGDLARFRANGVLEFLGRGDQQVKVRGYRVELGEIEHALARQPGIEACAAGLDQSSEGDARLVAYYVGAHARVTDLRAALSESLPDYMRPSLYVELPALPLTPNGKVDRRALKVPDDLREQRPEAVVGGRDTVELDLIRLWEDTLEVRPIGIHDNFFDLGGHSIIAVRLIARVSQHFGRPLALANLFQGASVAAMARLLRSDGQAPLWSSLVPIQARGSRPPIHCVAGAGGNVVYFHGLARALGGEQPFYGLQPPGLDGVTPPLATVEQLAAHYLKVIADAGQAPRIISGHSFGGLVAYEMVRQLAEAGTPAEALLLIDTPAPEFFTPTGADWSDAQWLAQVADIASHLYGVDLGVTLVELEALAPEAQYSHVHERLKATGVLPEDSDLAYFRGFIAVYQANLRARYVPKATDASTRVLLIRSRDAQPEHLVAAQYADMRARPDMGWQPYFAASIRVEEVLGDHLTMMHPAQVGCLAETMNAFISEEETT